MNSSDVDTHSKASAFNKFKHLLYKNHLRFSKVIRIGEHLHSFLVLSYDSLSSLSQFLSILIFELLNNDNVSRLATGKIPATPLYSESTKRKNSFDEKKPIKNIKTTKWSHAYKVYESIYNVGILNPFNPELQL